MSRKIIVACGGTGGHAFPGLAVAKALASRGHYVVVWASGRAIESAVMKAWTGPTFSTGARPLSARHLPAHLFSTWRCCREMRREKPDVLLAMGSYASLPPAIAATLCRVPVVLHEANTVPGRAVDVLSRFAKAVATSFDVTSDYLPGRTIVQTGLPVRAEIAGCPRFGDIPENAFTIFVTGGSQGAHRVNEIAAAALCLVAQDMKRRGLARPLHVIHQTGFNDEGTITGHYAAAGIPARVKAFEHEMGRAFASADLVIARAGASTCFELALAGKPAFFIPLPCALRDHQRFNAEAFAQAAAAHVGDQQALTPRALANWILHKIEHPQVLEKMAAQMRKLAQPDAADNVADLVERYALGG